MTGLDVHKDRIMEIACVVTNNKLQGIAEHPTIVVHQDDALLNGMSEWCTTTHTKVLARQNQRCVYRFHFVYSFLPSRPDCWRSAGSRGSPRGKRRIKF